MVCGVTYKSHMKRHFLMHTFPGTQIQQKLAWNVVVMLAKCLAIWKFLRGFTQVIQALLTGNFISGINLNLVLCCCFIKLFWFGFCSYATELCISEQTFPNNI